LIGEDTLLDQGIDEGAAVLGQGGPGEQCAGKQGAAFGFQVVHRGRDGGEA
jgi:hypothetical protein